MISKDENTLAGPYEGDNNTLIYAITFPTFEASSLDAFVTEISTGVNTELTLGVDYTLSEININGRDALITLIDSGQDWIDGGGGGLDTLWAVSIQHDPEAFQPSLFRQLGANTAITLEQTLDRLTMVIKSIYRELLAMVASVSDNADAIAANAAAIVINAAGIAANLLSITALEEFLYSKKQTLNNNVSNVPLTQATIDELVDNDMIFEYVAKRGAAIQYGKILVSNDSPFANYQLQKVGEAGVTFGISEAGGVGTMKYSTTNTTAGTIRYKLYKFTL